MKWRDVGMAEACEWMQGKTVVGDRSEFTYVEPCFERASVLRFTDGTKLACLSDWSGSLTDVMPGLSPEPPQFLIFD